MLQKVNTLKQPFGFILGAAIVTGLFAQFASVGRVNAAYDAAEVINQVCEVVAPGFESDCRGEIVSVANFTGSMKASYEDHCNQQRIDAPSGARQTVYSNCFDAYEEMVEDLDSCDQIPAASEARSCREGIIVVEGNTTSPSTTAPAANPSNGGSTTSTTGSTDTTGATGNPQGQDSDDERCSSGETAFCNPVDQTNRDICDGSDCAWQDLPIFKDYIAPALDILSLVVVPLITLVIILAGVQYSAASGDPGKVSAAKGRITNAIIALVSYIFLWAFLQWLIPGGVI